MSREAEAHSRLRELFFAVLGTFLTVVATWNELHDNHPYAARIVPAIVVGIVALYFLLDNNSAKSK
jgi:hypothetical protein